MASPAPELFERTATLLAESTGISSGISAVTEALSVHFSSAVCFVALSRSEGEIADLTAAVGLGAADFRRLESRLTKSILWRIFQLAKPIAIDDLFRDNILNFLAFGSGIKMLIAVPISLRGETVGLLALGFSPRAAVEENKILKTLAVIAAMIANSLKIERLLGEFSEKIEIENVALKQELKEKYDLTNIVGRSGPMKRVSEQVSQISRSNSIVLLRGEIGTGTEMVAGAIHYNSLRSKRPFVKVNCRGESESQVEGEIFGYEHGALGQFTSQRLGAFETADGGTVFLDNIDALPQQTQLKLYRVIQEREFERLGGTGAIAANVRLIAASTVDLDDAVGDGYFREDLYFRLNGYTITLPPLRERKSDILLLAEYFVEKYERVHNKHIKRISTSAIDMLMAYHFPGNVRELENTIERAVAASDSGVIHGRDLSPTLQTAEVTGTVTRTTLAAAVENFERDLIVDTLKTTRGIVAKAASMLDSTERILGYKIKKYDIDPRRFRR